MSSQPILGAEFFDDLACRHARQGLPLVPTYKLREFQEPDGVTSRTIWMSRGTQDYSAGASRCIGRAFMAIARHPSPRCSIGGRTECAQAYQAG